MTNPLRKKLQRLIEATGPLSIAEFMHICMADPEHGYYTSRTVLGETGDFVTSPEISQMFGELIGVWCIGVWQKLGMPPRLNLVELGPGNGTLMADLLRAASSIPKFRDALQVSLMETSPVLRETQAHKLATGNTAIQWIDDIGSIGEEPLLVVGNEFLDVIPFHQYVRQTGLWMERMVGIDKNGELGFCLGANNLDNRILPKYAANEPDGAVFEFAPAREATVRQISERLKACSGAALLIDYGHDKSGFGDTFQAVKNHQYCDPLQTPGQADLTSHVDFGALSTAARQEDCHVYPVMKQGEFLRSMGLLERAGQLGKHGDASTRSGLTEQVNRLAGPDTMGDLFKVFCVSSPKVAIEPYEPMIEAGQHP